MSAPIGLAGLLEFVVSLGLGSHVHYPVMYGTADAVVTNGYGRGYVGTGRPQLPREEGFDHAEPRRDLLGLVPGDVRAAIAAGDEAGTALAALRSSPALSLLCHPEYRERRR